MSHSSDPIFETVLALPLPQRAELAFQLLQSLDPPGEEISSALFGAELHERIESSRRGETSSHSLDETRKIVEKRLSEGRGL